MSYKEHLSAVDYLTLIEEALDLHAIDKPAASLLLKDMPDILDKINENDENKGSTYVSIRAGDVVFDSLSYKRIYYGNSNTIYEETWYSRGAIHREGDKPAFLRYHDDGKIQVQIFLKNGSYHREGGKPAYLRYDEHGNIITSQQWINGTKH